MSIVNISPSGTPAVAMDASIPVKLQREKCILSDNECILSDDKYFSSHVQCLLSDDKSILSDNNKMFIG